MPRSVPMLRILGGLLVVIAGLAYYFGVTIAAPVSLFFIAAGLAVILLAAFGRRARPGDVAIFVIGLIVLGAVVSSGLGAPRTSEEISKTVTRAQILSQRIEIVASTDVGSINISYSNRGDLGYQVNFTRSAFFFPTLFPGVSPLASLTNETKEGTLVLNATSRSYDVSIAVGTGYLLNVTATTGTGSIDVRTFSGEALGTVSLQSGTGSITANLTSRSIGPVTLQEGTGSITLSSSHLAPSGQRVPITLSTGTGSINFKVNFPTGTAASVDASSGMGSVNHNLQGFSVSPESSTSKLIATAGDVNAVGKSFVIQASTGLGSVTLESQFVG